MKSKAAHAASLRRRQRGVVVLQAAICTILLVTIFIGGLTFSHGLVVRHQMSNATNSAARTCALAEVPDLACVQNEFEANMQSVIDKCQGGPTIDFEIQNVGGIDVVNVTATCQYDPGFGGQLLSNEGIGGLTLTSRASVPLP